MDTSDGAAVVSLAEVEHAIEGRPRGLRFAPAIEARFEADTGRERCRHLMLAYAIAVVAYDLYLFADYVMLPDVFDTALAVKLGLATPLMLAGIVVLAFNPAAWLRETIAVGPAYVAISAFLLLAVQSHDPNAVYAHFPVLMGAVLVSFLMKPRFRFACVGTAGLLIAYAICVRLIAGFPVNAYVGAVILGALASVCALYANYTMERAARRAYLAHLHGQVRNGHLALANEELNRISNLDPMTGLCNRRGFDAQAAVIWPAAVELGQSVALLMIDVDYFKRFNDRYGHQAGDACLGKVAQTARDQLRHDDELIARYGGEEFVVLLPRADMIDGIRAAERIRRAIEARAIAHEAVRLGVVSVSIGVAATPATVGGSPKNLIEAADAALYEAKARGRNRVWPPILSADPELMVQSGNGRAASAA